MTIFLLSILVLVISLSLIHLSFYFINKEDRTYLKHIANSDVVGIESNITEISLEDSIEERYFVRMNFNEIYKTISHEDFSSLITDGSLDREKFDEYVNKKITPYFEAVFGDKELVKNSKGEFYTRKSDTVPNFSTLYDQINGAYSIGITDIRVDIDGGDGPGTDGLFAEEYMEVDNSQQKLYVWKDGVVEKVIGLSGPVYGFQVYGVFPIVDKGREPIAPGGKYMPYWMAFHYSRKQDSWYGLHGLIWMYKEDGGKWFEPESNIYTRQSAGCIRMLVADAKYLYENFEKGDLLLIHE